MARHRLKLHDLIRILAHYGVECDRSRGKGGHLLFMKTIEGSKHSYPVPNRNDVLPSYVKGARRKFRLLPEDGISDEEFFGK